MGATIVFEIHCVPERSGTRLETEIPTRPEALGTRLLSPLLARMTNVMGETRAKDQVDIAAAAAQGNARTGISP